MHLASRHLPKRNVVAGRKNQTTKNKNIQNLSVRSEYQRNALRFGSVLNRVQGVFNYGHPPNQRATQVWKTVATTLRKSQLKRTFYLGHKNLDKTAWTRRAMCLKICLRRLPEDGFRDGP